MRTKKNNAQIEMAILLMIVLVFHAIFSDWEHFKLGSLGNF
jgi:hypothetical protein